jgi:hypothetical protein
VGVGPDEVQVMIRQEIRVIVDQINGVGNGAGDHETLSELSVFRAFNGRQVAQCDVLGFAGRSGGQAGQEKNGRKKKQPPTHRGLEGRHVYTRDRPPETCRAEDEDFC